MKNKKYMKTAMDLDEIKKFLSLATDAIDERIHALKDNDYFDDDGYKKEAEDFKESLIFFERLKQQAENLTAKNGIPDFSYPENYVVKIINERDWAKAWLSSGGRIS